VSRQHAKLSLQPTGWFIADLGSTNGTFLNGLRIEPQTLHAVHSGDKVGFSGKITAEVVEC
jgi:pSer/pThr/pTyr-binding forkhead associated (FHA) protein